MLTPILVAGYGRSGTTAMMSLLSSAREIFFDRQYPYENRYLTYIAKLECLRKRDHRATGFTPEKLCDFYDSSLSGFPWDAPNQTCLETDCLVALWKSFSDAAVQTNPNLTFYAEKVPAWMPTAISERLISFTFYLFRDPRDVFLSANAFLKKLGCFGFGRQSGDTDIDHARTLAFDYLNYYENYFVNRHTGSSQLVLYEDLVSDSHSFIIQLREKTGLKLEPSLVPDHLESHRTSESVASSINRHQRENSPPGICSFLEACLKPEMQQLGYSTTSWTNTVPRVDFFGDASTRHYRCSAHGELTLGSDWATATISGNDFWIVPAIEPFQASTVNEMWVSLKGNIGDHCSLYWRSRNQQFSEERSIHLPYLGAMQWQLIRFRLSNHLHWRGEIAELRLDPFNATCEKTSGIAFIRWLRMIP